MSTSEFYFKSADKDLIEDAMKLAFGDHRRANAWRKEEGALILCWNSAPEKNTPLPVSLTYTVAADIAKLWLPQNKPATKPADIDGSSAEGYEIKSISNSYDFISIRSVWIYYGK